MSLILEALKQSEKERQQQAQSVTDTLYIKHPPSRRNIWIPVIIALLLVNLGIYALLYLGNDTGITTEPPNAEEILEAARQDREAKPATPPITTQPAPRIASRILRPLEKELGNARVSKLEPATASRPTVNTAVIPNASTTPPAEDEQRSVPKEKTGTESIQEMDDATRDALQHFEINTIVYSDNPARRFALINMQKVQEGATLPGSEYRIEKITPKGLVLQTGSGLVLFSSQE